ncbi:hypothetical protein EVAR_16491_1 [Eumeta japonica]|uniref:Uncharacterized protein n=1 Tax=Eumeta variegata TaxID=151549 RepID=A0A4C1UKR3_EUMVA|nr:hypothetical protein EVAR_16491_1 [Eumeta japonica]
MFPVQLLNFDSATNHSSNLDEAEENPLFRALRTWTRCYGEAGVLSLAAHTRSKLNHTTARRTLPRPLHFRSNYSDLEPARPARSEPGLLTTTILVSSHW